MGGSTRSGRTKYMRLRDTQETRMKHYEAGNMDLYTYQLSMGALTFSQNKEHLVDEIDLNVDAEEVEISGEEIPSDNEADVTTFDTSLINNDLLKKVTTESPKKKDNKKRTKLKHQRQKAGIDQRTSVIRIGSPVFAADLDEDSVQGEELRQRRRLLSDPSTAAVLAVAAVATAAVVSSDVSNEAETIDTSVASASTREVTDSYEPAVNDCFNSFDLVGYLKSICFSLSKSQKSTPGDGNCMFHALADQSVFVDHLDARHKIVTSIYEMIENGTIFWDDSQPLSDWIEAMMVPQTYGDSYVLQVAANLLGRDIIIIPSNKKSAHNPYGYILIESCTVNANPLFLFYFEEHIFGLAAHYQSIMPVGECPILKHYMWAKTTEKSIRLSSSSSIFSSTRIDNKKRKNCEESNTLSKKRKIAHGCHICTLSFSKGVKKKCSCGKYCHKSCVGKCSDV